MTSYRRSTHCKRGHRWTEKNMRTYVRARDGVKCVTCRSCESHLRKLKYRSDPTYRDSIKTNNQRWRERTRATPMESRP